ncbi:DUF3560 domain-containing protein [Streptomyces scabiei]|uniref:DUF3560 domain-containing protein n=1 Tax=Streptomyces scabiei TaxID=1930 RepID=UPI0029AA3857|nr:DUF3560 domain-containing protein [Streptomyces scabiei]MDX3126575.1 DUF3560 domain-containing protein [Streptomyces scabiei]MDX3203014.1 DUF3560 domain-containing protein [Streptomyces scabiei]MDX3223137.1 DUF3560 domain-containing protein [Streptomyces scabiei]
MTDTPNCRHHGAMALRAEAAPDTAPTWYCPDPVCHNTELRPAPGVTARGTVAIMHTRADGTLLEGSRKGDGVWEIVREHGFRSFRSLGCLGVQQSRDKAAKRWHIDGAANALRRAGWTVVVDIDEDTRRSFADAEADRVERAEDRANRFTEYAGNAASRSQAHHGEAHRIASSIPFGQPILVGHHSERRARRDVERIDTNMRKGIAEGEKSEYYARRAAASGSYEAFRKNPPRTLRRIKTLEAEMRRVEKWLRGESAGGFTRALTPATVAELNRRKEELTDEIGCWQHVIAKAEEKGFVVWGPQHFTKGDFARIGGRWYEVLRVNKTTLTVPGGPDIQPVISLETHAYPGMRGTRPYDEVRARMSAEEMAGALAAARAKREGQEGASASA